MKARDVEKFETGNRKLETGNWKLETGNWKLETEYWGYESTTKWSRWDKSATNSTKTKF
jgi:hypothetical protein